MLRITVDGEPTPAARPRFGGGHTYQPRKNSEYRARVQKAARAVMGDSAPMTGAVVADVKLYRKYKTTAHCYGDIDNFLKALFDGLNQIVFVDDKQIVRCVVEKFQDKANPRAEIVISEHG